MKRVSLLICFFGYLLLLGGAVQAGEITAERLKQLSSRFPFAIVLEPGEEQAVRFLFADINRHIHIYRLEKGKLVLEWETTNLGSPVTALFIADLFKDGEREIVIGTASGRILIYGAREYDLLWENLQDRFDKIECMTSANIDTDPQDELIFVADSFLYIYDSENKSREWQSQGNFTAQEIVLANVDDDEQDEIILNTGVIFDSRFYNIEFQVEGGFGSRINLIDINGDGIEEVVGEVSGFSLRIFDVYSEREIW